MSYFDTIEIEYMEDECNMAAITIEDELKKFNKRYYQLKLENSNVENFQKNVKHYIKMIDTAISEGESEEHIKNITNSFLKTSFFSDEKYTINTNGKIDSSIKVNGKIEAIIETKKPSNKSEMASKDNINVKALHESIFYYMVKTRDCNGKKVKRIPDVEIRRIVITDTKKWVLIDANEIEKIVDGYLERLFYKYQNMQLIYAHNTDKFYEDIKVYLNTLNINEILPYVFFEINEYVPLKKVKYLYKIFNKAYLLKNIANNEASIHVLNNKFYQELLYIMGLKEKVGKSSKTIEIDHTIKNSLADQIYNILKNDKEYSEIECIEKTFELVIIWINRLLFIKLFEGQLISFNGDSSEYHILDNEKISSFQDLQELFFDVLGKKDRDESSFLNQFLEIPYLNSSLFERQDIEKKDININLMKNLDVTLKKNSIIGKRQDNKVKLLEYIIDFLNNYSFSSEVGANNTIIEGKDIIDASVLGLIFEKLNGYRDGSFYTPSIITEYMCMKSIEKAVINKINLEMKWNCSDLFEIKAKRNGSFQEAKKINDIINSIKICDPSVGSGHFLVSALNRVIAIKKQLGVLFKYGKEELLTEYDIDIVDDVLRVFDGQGKSFRYDKSNSLSQDVQKTLFNEKRIVIENCLFGVDLNNKAVAICQLRLWIELLKNAYYEQGIMETLPNIDINIKSGNSLINKLVYNVGGKVGESNFSLNKIEKDLIKTYKKLVQEYKRTANKQRKNEITRNITAIKQQLHSAFSQISFSFNDADIVSYNYDTSNSVYKGAFEWAIEFPELLNEKGIFEGFDCIIGNPPYGLLNKKQNQNTSISVSGELLDYYKKDKMYEPAKGGVLNIYRLFICRCFTLLKNNGQCCLIFPLAFMCDLSAKNIRQYVMENFTIDYLEAFPERDIDSKRVFKEVKMSVCILGATKKQVDYKYKFPVRLNADKYVDENNEQMQISYDEIKMIDETSYSIPLIKQRELNIFLKITKDCKRLGEYCKCYTGEIDISLDKKYITLSNANDLMLRGAQVQKYYITNDISQGDIMYLKGTEYLQNNDGARSRHHEKRRIVMQGITGVNEKWRLKMTMAQPPYYCANSVNYLMPSQNNDFDLYLLGILNSKLINWYFAKLSTNSNVNGYEIDSLPIKLGNEIQYKNIVELVTELLNDPGCGNELEIDKIVYEIYGINEYEIPIVEG